MYKFLILLSFTLVSCSTYNTRNRVSTGDVVFKVGVIQEKEWSDKMVFKRTSWYSEATLSNDILLHKMDHDSKFSSWLGSDQMSVF